jgi:hypothetical protein
MALRMAGTRTAFHLILPLALASGSCFRSVSAPPQPPVKPPAARVPTSGWADRTLRSLTLEEKVAQMIGVRGFGIYTNPRSAEYRELVDAVETLKVGHITLFESDVYAAPKILNDLQSRAKIPLLVAAAARRRRPRTRSRIPYPPRRRADSVCDGDRRYRIRGGGVFHRSRYRS